MTLNEAKKKPLLKSGMRHSDVPTIKAILRSQGLWKGTDSADFGPKLEVALKYFQSTHLGPDGKFLQGDGECGPKTWWALYNSTGAAQKSFIVAPSDKKNTEDHITHFEHRYGRLPAKRKEFLRAAFAEYAKDVKEIPDGSNQGGEVNKYIKGFGPAPWCALFISWLFYLVMGRYPGNARQAHVQTGWRTAALRKRTYAKGKRLPVPGDLAIWHFAKGQGHVSVVVAVSSDGKQINTIGGNEGNRVKLGLRTLAKEPNLVGFIDLFDDAIDVEARHIPFGLLAVDEKAKMLTAGSSR